MLGGIPDEDEIVVESFADEMGGWIYCSLGAGGDCRGERAGDGSAGPDGHHFRGRRQRPAGHDAARAYGIAVVFASRRTSQV